ncbi:transposase [Rhizobium leguminosarum]|nr:transposase [Rhizobium leguminosarum]NEH50793.1 transposase [Rhizobium leguminosarum]
MRNRIARRFNRLKNFCRLATRYDKTASSSLGSSKSPLSAFRRSYLSTEPNSQRRQCLLSPGR